MGLGSFFKRNKKDKEEAEESHISINTEECGGCEKCVIACPNNVLIINDEKSFVNNSFGCKRCKVCVAICPNDCIEVN
jgi:Na+-translocating ferredoxin:NAD+ oxidoreductase RNF subunit RnfB